jgi:hypothetical protein
MAGMETSIRISLAALWAAYGRRESGRVECPIRLADGQTVTHIYRGFGAIRLENINGTPKRHRGFQGVELAAAPQSRAASTHVRIMD